MVGGSGELSGQSESALGDDVPLDLGRPHRDRSTEGLEVLRHPRHATEALVIDGIPVLHVEGCRTLCLRGEVRGALGDLRSEELEHRVLG